jgi:hypothetical protein
MRSHLKRVMIVAALLAAGFATPSERAHGEMTELELMVAMEPQTMIQSSVDFDALHAQAAEALRELIDQHDTRQQT